MEIFQHFKLNPDILNLKFFVTMNIFLLVLFDFFLFFLFFYCDIFTNIHATLQVAYCYYYFYSSTCSVLW